MPSAGPSRGQERKRSCRDEGEGARWFSSETVQRLNSAIDRLLVQPLANLIATEQVRDGDVISVDFCSASGELLFWKESSKPPRQEEVAATGTDEAAHILDANVAQPVWTTASQTQVAPV